MVRIIQRDIFQIVILPLYNWNIVENGVKHHKPTKPLNCYYNIMTKLQCIRWKTVDFFDTYHKLSIENVENFCTWYQYPQNEQKITERVHIS